MLRTKQIGTLSNSAKTFFLSGSRCGAADGSSCTCSDDDACFSRRPSAKNGILHPQKASTLVSKTSARVINLIPGHVMKTAASAKSEAVSAVVSSRRTNSVNYVGNDEAVQNDVAHVPSLMSDQFVKVGIAAVSFLSDLANCKIPTTFEGSGVRNYMLDPTRTISTIKPSKVVKSIRRENIPMADHPTYYPEVAAGSNTKSKHHGTKGRVDNKQSTGKSFNHHPNTGAGVSETCTIFETRDKRGSITQRTSHLSNSNNSSVQISETKVVRGITESFNRYPRENKMLTVNPTMSRQFTSTGHVLERVSHILRTLKWSPEAEQALGNLNFSMDAYQANQVLKQIQDYSVALGFFNWLKWQNGFKHDGHTYTTMVGILGRAKQFSAINKLLDQMVRDGCKPNVVTYNRLIHSYGRANFLNDAVRVFYWMQESGCEPDRVTYCTLIDIHAKAGFLDVAMNTYYKMQEAGLSPDTFTYSAIINCLGKAGHLTAAHKLFCEMVDQGCVPNLVTYNIMIALQAKARNYEVALKLYRDLQNAGFEPDKVTYSIVMEVLGHCGHLDEVEAVFVEMQRRNWVPDEPVYGLLVDLWGKTGNVEKARDWYQAMLNAGLCPNVPTCNSLLSAFLRVHKLSDAYDLLQSMMCLGLNPSLQTYTLLLSCCTEARSAYDMGFFCELMAITCHPAHTFLLSMPSSGPDGQNVRDHVDKFLDLMHSEDRESKRGLVDSVVDFLHKSGLKEEAGSVWEVAAQKNVYPDAVKEKSACYWLINLHVMSDGTAVTALSRTLAGFRQNMLLSGIGPTRIDIVTGWGRRSRVTGSSLVRQAVQELLNMFSFPFFTENGNSGCFVGCGEALNSWLHQSYVDRMHLL